MNYSSLVVELRNIRGSCRGACQKAADIIEKLDGPLYPSFSDFFEAEAKLEHTKSLPVIVGDAVYVLRQCGDKIVPESEKVEKVCYMADEKGEVVSVNGHTLGQDAFLSFEEALSAECTGSDTEKDL